MDSGLQKSYVTFKRRHSKMDMIEREGVVTLEGRIEGMKDKPEACAGFARGKG